MVEGSEKTFSFCGTVEYMAPEVRLHAMYSQPSKELQFQHGSRIISIIICTGCQPQGPRSDGGLVELRCADVREFVA